jgi:excinuclease UvrABC ATPase subunit
MEINLEVMKPVLFSGVSGVGKSAIVLDLIDRIRETKNYMSIVLNFSAQTTAIATQVPPPFYSPPTHLVLFGHLPKSLNIA